MVSWFDSRKGKNFIFVSSPKATPVLGPTQTPNQWSPGNVSCLVKLSGREVENSLLPIKKYSPAKALLRLSGTAEINIRLLPKIVKPVSLLLAALLPGAVKLPGAHYIFRSQRTL